MDGGTNKHPNCLMEKNVERIESTHNAEGWQRVMDDVNKAGGKKERETMQIYAGKP